MTKIKLCGLSRPCDIEAANELKPEYVGFVFTLNSKRRISEETAAGLRKLLDPHIETVGVFVNEAPEAVAGLLNGGVIDIAQLHGTEDESYIRKLKSLTGKPIIKAFRIERPEDTEEAEKCSADFVLLDSGAGTGRVFDWPLLCGFRRSYFLAGGLSPENAGEAVRRLKPYAADVSSGIETNGIKDRSKMAEFINAVRRENRL